jgi:hypothetical protein
MFWHYFLLVQLILKFFHFRFLHHMPLQRYSVKTTAPPCHATIRLGGSQITQGIKFRFNQLYSLLHTFQHSANLNTMLKAQPMKGTPMHSLWLNANTVQEARLPFKPIPDFIYPPFCRLTYAFPLAGISQLVTIPTSKDCRA